MATSRGQTPPANLKERIAALQQRNVSPTLHQSVQATPRTLPPTGNGTLRDKIAKFEEKGGVPIPRSSFATAPPQLAENAPSRKRGELYGNRVSGLGRPSGAPISRPTSPQGSSDESSSPRKRCVSTGGALSTTPPNFSTDEPVPPLPNGLSATMPRRNSLAVNFGSARRVASAGDADDIASQFTESTPPSISSLLQEKSTEASFQQPLNQESVSPAIELGQPATIQTTNTASELSELSSVAEAAPSPSSPKNQTPTKVEPTSPKSLRSPTASIRGVPRATLQTPIVKQNSTDGTSDYESAPQSAVSEPSPSLPKPTPTAASSVAPSKPTDAPPSTAKPVATEPVNLSSPPRSARTTKVITINSPPRSSPVTISAPDPKVPVPPSAPSPDLTTPPRSESKPTFRAVVHRKAADNPITAVEAPASANLAPPAATPAVKQRRNANVNVVQVPPSPGGGFSDLAVLLEDAAMLESRLTDGDSTGLKADFLSATPTSATFQQDPRSSSASTLTEHVPMPSVHSGSQSARSVSVPSIRESLIDGEIREGDETDGRSLASTTFSQRSPSHRKYLDGIRRLTGRRSSGYMPGTYPRDSMSVSSEDSSPVATPSDNGKGKGFGIAWPSGSPKKSPSFSRSTSFADKIFRRDRTRSSASKAESNAPERLSFYEGSQPNLTLSFDTSNLMPEPTRDGGDLNVSARPASWVSPCESISEFSPTSSVLDKEIFDAFPSVPETLPPGPGNANNGRASTLPVKGGRNHRVSMA